MLLSTVECFNDFKQTLSVSESFIRLQSDQIRHCGDDAGHFKWGPASLATAFLCLKRWIQLNFWPPQTDVTLQHLPTLSLHFHKPSERHNLMSHKQYCDVTAIAGTIRLRSLFCYHAPWSCQRLVKPCSAVYSSCNLISVSTEGGQAEILYFNSSMRVCDSQSLISAAVNINRPLRVI